MPDYLKIDGSFIPDAKTDQKQWIFVEMMNDIAHRLKIESIAECVEDELTLTNLRQIGVDLGQGFLFGRPQSILDKSQLYERINVDATAGQINASGTG